MGNEVLLKFRGSSCCGSFYRGVRAVVLALPLLSYSWPLAEAKNSPSSDSKCLASAVYHEARGQSLKAQRGVIDVVLNRAVASGKTVCEVVREPFQFSWLRSKGMKPYDDKQRELLSKALEHKPLLKNEKFFYSGPKPGWARRMACRPIHDLTFCRERRE